MHLKIWFYIIVIGLSLTWIQEAETKPLQVVNIGIVRDGSSPVAPELGDLLAKEIIDLTSREFDVRFPKDLQLDGGWSLEGVKTAVDRLLAEPRVNVVIALGILASNEAGQRKKLAKPVIAPFVIDPLLQGLPLKKGTSGIKNLNYLVSLKDFESNLTAFKEVFVFSRLACLVDRVLLEGFPLLKDQARTIAQKHGVQMTVVPVDASAQAALEGLSPDAEAVMLFPLVRLPSPEFDRLVAGLTDRRLPSFSVVGRREVERGIAVSISPDVDVSRITRTIAANVQRILSGTDAGQLNVSFVRGQQLTINMATVRAIDKWPSFQVLSEADLLNEKEEAGPRLTLFDAVRLAMEGNLDLAAAGRKVEAGLGQVRQRRSDLLPQVLIGTSGNLIGAGPDTFGTGADPERAAIAFGGFRQTIYSDDLWSRYTVEKKTQLSREEERNKTRLDTAHDAAIAYLTVLRAKTVRRIEKDNLKLTRSNLELAVARVAVGYALKDEVFRWETEVANAQKLVLSAEAQERQAEVSLNRVLNRPLEEAFSTTEQTLEDPAVLGDTGEVFAYIENPRGFQVFRDFEVQEGVKAAPEVRRLDDLVAAKERSVTNAKRAYWMPDLALQGSAVDNYSHTGGVGGLTLPAGPIGFSQNQDHDGSYVGSIMLTFPLFEGGNKNATAFRVREELRELQLERDATRQQVDQGIRNALYQTGASYPSIRLSQKAAESARKTLDLVIDQYARGEVDIIRLLNSQNADLTANLAAANAVYDFLIDFARVQRATGQMSFFQGAEERAAWLERLKQFFANTGVSPMQR